MAKKSAIRIRAGLEKAARKMPGGARLKGRTVVQILPRLVRGGAERGTLEIAEAVIAEGGRAVVISNGGPMVSRLRQLGGEHFELPVHSKIAPLWPLMKARVGKVLDATGADLVHIRSRAPAWIAMAPARKRGIPVVTTIHNRFHSGNPVKRFYNGIMVRGDHVIAISDYVAGLVLDEFPEVRDRLGVIHRGVDLRHFDPDAVSKERLIAANETLRIPDDRPVILMPARPTGWKGADILVDAAHHISDMNFSILLVGAGDGSKAFQDGLIRRINEKGLGEKVRLCHGVDDMAAALMLAHVVVMPSTTPEPFGRVAIEAQAMGCPVIAFDHGGARESIVNRKTGWLANPVTAEALAGCLVKALRQSRQRRREIALAARRLVRRDFTSEKMCAETIAVYARLLKGRP